MEKEEIIFVAGTTPDEVAKNFLAVLRGEKDPDKGFKFTSTAEDGLGKTSNTKSDKLGSQIIPGDFLSFDMDINHEPIKMIMSSDWQVTAGFSEIPVDAPPYHSVAGWALQKEMAENKLRREKEMRDCANWFLYMADSTGEPRYMIVAERLMEIERGE